MRVSTRGDLDGLASTVFLSVMNDVTDIRFAHPRDMQEGEVEVTADDIVVNLPYVPGCGMWFDHHGSEDDRVDVSARIFGGINNTTVVALGHSIFNRTCQTDVGKLLGEYGGGGHAGAGTAQFPAAEAPPQLQEIIERLKDTG